MYWLLSLLLLTQEWPMFGRDPQHTNAALVEATAQPKLLWTFRPGEHLWKYTRRASVWSSSAVIARLGQDLRLFVGSYDRNVYCLDGKTGREVWRYTTGGAVNAAPVFYRAQGAPSVAVVSTDRVIYGLDAQRGGLRWSYAVYPWTFTAFEAIASSPIAVEAGDATHLVIALWYSDRKPLRNIQRGEVLCLDGATGAVVWRRQVSVSALSSPAYANIHGRPTLFVAGIDGNLYCLDAADGRLRWTFTSAIPITSSPLLGDTGQRPVVMFGTQFGLFFCLDAETSTELWRYKTGMQITSAGAVATLDQVPFLFVPSYDRHLYGLELASGRLRWRFETTQHIASAPIVVMMGGRLSVVCASLDNHLYAVEAADGRLRWSHPLRRRPWFYEARGETVWPSPSAVSYEEKPLLVLPWYDGTVYAFSDQ